MASPWRETPSMQPRANLCQPFHDCGYFWSVFTLGLYSDPLGFCIRRTTVQYPLSKFSLYRPKYSRGVDRWISLFCEGL